MNEVLLTMLSKHAIDSISSAANSLKEVAQEIILCGLSRTDFFARAAFYGGTSLRIFHGLDRFSEDLDFSLKQRDEDFDLERYLPAIKKELLIYGLSFELAIKEKSRESAIQTAYAKSRLRETLMLVGYGDFASKIGSDEIVKIKLEVDLNPPPGATFVHKYGLLPSPYQVALYDLPSLFAGKIHAILARGWKTRVKGRDLYDYLFYVARGIHVNLEHLEHRLRQSGHVTGGDSLDIGKLKEMLSLKFAALDYREARADVSGFVASPFGLEIWSSELFIDSLNRLM